MKRTRLLSFVLVASTVSQLFMPATILASQVGQDSVEGISLESTEMVGGSTVGDQSDLAQDREGSEGPDLTQDDQVSDTESEADAVKPDGSALSSGKKADNTLVDSTERSVVTDESTEDDGTENEGNDPSDSSDDTSDDQQDELETEADRLAALHANDVADGTYVFYSSLRTDGVMDAKSGGKTNGTAVQLYAVNGTEAQWWRISHDGNYVVIENVSSGKALDVTDGHAMSGAAIQLYTSNGTLAQRWIAVRQDDDSVTFLSALDPTLVIELPGAKTTNGTATKLYADNGTDAQRWVLEDVEAIKANLDTLALTYIDAVPDGVYAIVGTPSYKRMVLDVNGGSSSNGANVQIFSSNATNAQRWRVTHDDKGYVTLQCISSGKVLDVKSALGQSGTNVQQYASNGSDAQKWIIIPTGDGTYKVQSALWPERVLDIASGKMANKTNVQIYASNGSDAQSFFFVSANPTVEVGERHEEIEGKWFSIRPSYATDMALDIASASLDNGANAQIYASNESIAQLFSFEYHDGYYIIRNASSGKALDVAEGDVAPGANTQQWSANPNSTNQLFAVNKNNDGTYTFVNKGTGLALDVWGAGTANSTNVDAFTPNGSSAQCFELREHQNLIKEGVYSICVAGKTSLVLDVKSGSTGNGANVQLYTSNSSLAQRWYFKLVAGEVNTYTIESTVSAKLLTADSSGNVVQRSNSGSAWQQWIPAIDEDGFILVNAADSSKVLDIEDGSLASTANVQIYADNGTAAQRFRLCAGNANLSNGTYFIQMALATSSVLDVANGSKDNGANVRIYAQNDTGAQKWNVKKNSDGTYTIINAASGKALDVKNASKTSGANVQQYTANNTAAQKWYIAYVPGGFRIQSALDSNLVLDVDGGSTKNGANVRIFTDEGKVAQRFVFKKTTYTPPLPARQQAMINKAQGISSSTKWLLMVDTTGCRVGVFSGKKGDWTCKYYWKCSPGKPSTPTVLGSYTVKGKGYSFGSGYTCYYYTQFYGDYLFHSILYNQGTRVVQDGRLGQQLSHGCVRLAINNAKWIYDNIPRGTKVYIYK